MNRITICPNCSKRLRVSEQITDETVICPHCLSDMDNPQPGYQIRAADINTDVKRDTRAGGIVLAVLILLCLVGIATAIFRFRYHDSTEALPLFVGSCAALGLVLIIAIIGWMVRSIRLGRSGAHLPILTGALAITLIVVSFVLITIVAVFIFFLAACSKLLGH